MQKIVFLVSTINSGELDQFLMSTLWQNIFLPSLLLVASLLCQCSWIEVEEMPHLWLAPYTAGGFIDTCGRARLHGDTLQKSMRDLLSSQPVREEKWEGRLEKGGENVKQSIQRDGWENVYFGYSVCVDINLLCSWNLNKSILKGLNGIACARAWVCLSF